MNKIIKFGIIGGGGIGSTHATAINRIESAQLAAVCNASEEKAKKFAREFGCDYYTDYHALLQRDDIDIVNICTPSGTHSTIGVAAARAGKHVIVEKPIDISLEAADRLINACRQEGVKLTCIFQRRFDQDITKLKSAISSGRLGQLNFGAAHTKAYRSQEYYDSGAWRGTWELDGGGALINQSIHYVDLLQYIMGPVEEVAGYCATRAHERIEVEDIAAAAVKFVSGAIGLIEGNTAAYPGLYSRLDIYGADGCVVVADEKIIEWKLQGENISDITGDRAAISMPGASASSPTVSYHSHMRQIEDFINAVRNNREPAVTGQDARHSLAIVLAIYESARAGKSVKVK